MAAPDRGGDSKRRPRSPNVPLTERFPSYKPAPGMENLVSTSEAAAHLGVAHNALTNWIAKDTGFPTPKVIAAGRGLWDRDEVTTWHQDWSSQPARGGGRRGVPRGPNMSKQPATQPAGKVGSLGRKPFDSLFQEVPDAST